MIPTDKSEPQLLPAPILASNIERDTATTRLQAAFAEHRLTDDEFDQRIRQALTARTTAELDGLTADLPAAAPALVVTTAQGGKPGRFAVALKSLDQPGRPLDGAAEVLLRRLQGQRAARPPGS